MSLNLWKLLNMRYPSQLERQCNKGFVSTVASVCTVRSRAPGGCERGEAVPAEMHCSGGIVCDLAQQI